MKEIIEKILLCDPFYFDYNWGNDLRTVIRSNIPLTITDIIENLKNFKSQSILKWYPKWTVQRIEILIKKLQ